MSNWEFNLGKQGKKKDLPDPFGYLKNIPDYGEIEKKNDEMKKLMENKINSVATSGANQIFMALLMFWLMGGGLNLFTIIFTFQFIMQPVKALINTNAAFKQFENKGMGDLFIYKLKYLAIHGITLAIALYKFYGIGLLPLSPADWIDLIPVHSQEEIVYPLND